MIIDATKDILNGGAHEKCRRGYGVGQKQSLKCVGECKTLELQIIADLIGDIVGVE